MEEFATTPERTEIMKESLLTIAMEAWRFGKVFERVLMKLDAGEQTRYAGQLRWFIKKLRKH